MQKKCTKCGEIKDLSEFRKRSNQNGYRSWCKKCADSYTNKETPNAFWTKLKSNLRRSYGEFNATTEEIKNKLGEPNICHICGGLIESRKEAELDHVIPLSKGGETSLDNLKWAHKLCNRMKHDLRLDEMVEHIEKILKYQKELQKHGDKGE